MFDPKWLKKRAVLDGWRSQDIPREFGFNVYFTEHRISSGIMKIGSRRTCQVLPYNLQDYE